MSPHKLAGTKAQMLIDGLRILAKDNRANASVEVKPCGTAVYTLKKPNQEPISWDVPNGESSEDKWARYQEEMSLINAAAEYSLISIGSTQLSVGQEYELASAAM